MTRILLTRIYRAIFSFLWKERGIGNPPLEDSERGIVPETEWDTLDNSRPMYNCYESPTLMNFASSHLGLAQASGHHTAANIQWVGGSLSTYAEPCVVHDPGHEFQLADGNLLSIKLTENSEGVEIDIDTDIYTSLIEPGKIIIRRQFDEENNTGHNNE